MSAREPSVRKRKEGPKGPGTVPKAARPVAQTGAGEAAQPEATVPPSAVAPTAAPESEPGDVEHSAGVREGDGDAFEDAQEQLVEDSPVRAVPPAAAPPSKAPAPAGGGGAPAGVVKKEEGVAVPKRLRLNKQPYGCAYDVAILGAIAPDAEDAELLQEHDDPFLYKGKKPGMEARGAALVKFLFEQGVFPCAVSYEAVEERVQQLWKEATAWFASWAHPDKMPTGGSATTRMEDGKEVPWPYEPWMLTARAVYQRRQEKEGVVIKAAVVAKLEADDKRAADAVARVRAMLLTVPKGSEQHESLKTELAVKQAELAAATAARKCKGKPAEKDQADADADGAGPSKPEKGDRTSGIMRQAEHLVSVADKLVDSLERSAAERAREAAEERASRERIAKMQADAQLQGQQMQLQMFMQMFAAQHTPAPLAPAAPPPMLWEANALPPDKF